MRIDLTTKNAAIGIVLGMDLMFFGVAVLLSLHPQTAALGGEVWKLFTATNGGLLLILNAESKRSDGPGTGSTSAPKDGTANPTN